MYGNVETALDKAWGPGEGCPLPDEDPYEPLDPSPSPGPPPKARPSPPGVALVTPRVAPVALVALVALLVTLLLALGTIGARRISALEAALEVEKAKEPPRPIASSSFLLYNQHHSGCVEASGSFLTVTACAPSSPAQLFQWLPGGRLRHLATGLCVGVSEATPGILVMLRPCRENSELQRWKCGQGALLALAATVAGTALHFNFGHEVRRRVVLYEGSGNWSRWLVYGTKRDVCSWANRPPCSKGWRYFRNSCYFFSQLEASWDNSQIFCSALGSQLLEVDDTKEKIHVQSHLQGPAWLGIRYRRQEGTWRRQNGTAVTPNTSWWHRDEPNPENCAAVRPDGLWADYPCETTRGWVCEGPP
ncbi:macrophage mannose receptor 1-like [Catharus ustulatus]|uniref:macrophage mannose receptor 1-like n=1 Tax=Catharus ustulatus TaxID=91951 RepID=UPI00140D1F71|nr:macrophage mannose receptor 1-like [Catharus ustulatus]